MVIWTLNDGSIEKRGEQTNVFVMGRANTSCYSSFLVSQNFDITIFNSKFWFTKCWLYICRELKQPKVRQIFDMTKSNWNIPPHKFSLITSQTAFRLCIPMSPMMSVWHSSHMINVKCFIIMITFLCKSDRESFFFNSFSLTSLSNRLNHYNCYNKLVFPPFSFSSGELRNNLEKNINNAWKWSKVVWMWCWVAQVAYRGVYREASPKPLCKW